MKSYLFALGIAAVLPFSLAGCGGASFEDACNDSCECESGDDAIASCKTDCQQYADFLDTTGCSSEADDLVDCAGGDDISCEDVDDTEDDDSCSSESAALSSCVSEYCADHEDECSAAFESTGRAATFARHNGAVLKVVRGSQF